MTDTVGLGWHECTLKKAGNCMGRYYGLPGRRCYRCLEWRPMTSDRGRSAPPGSARHRAQTGRAEREKVLRERVAAIAERERLETERIIEAALSYTEIRPEPGPDIP